MANDVKCYTLRGKAKFPCLNIPKSYDNSSFTFVEDYNKGAYSCILLLDPEDKSFKAIQKQLQTEYDKLFEEFKDSKQGQMLVSKGMELKQAGLPISADTNKEGEPTGKTAVKFKRNAVNFQGNKAKIQFIDRFKNAINLEDLPELSSGSDLAIKFNCYTWNKATDKKTAEFGITFCILGVQVIEAVTYSGDTDWGFDFEESESETEKDEMIGEDSIPF